MLQFIVGLNDTVNNTGVQFSISINKKLFVFQRFDKILIDRLRVRGVHINFLFLFIMLTKTYYDQRDGDLQDVEQREVFLSPD